MVAPQGSLVFHEEAWNAYPFCRTGECRPGSQASRGPLAPAPAGRAERSSRRPWPGAPGRLRSQPSPGHAGWLRGRAPCWRLTGAPAESAFGGMSGAASDALVLPFHAFPASVITNEYMKDDFFIKIETWHKPDLGTSDNVHDLDPNTWKDVEVVHIDIADRSQVEPGDYKADEDPALFQSVKTKRGPLGSDWKKELAANEECPKMCAYKLVTIKFKWWGLQNKVENFIQKQEKRIFTNFHRQLFCWIDRWIDLTMEDIRRIEDETQRELEAVRVSAQRVPVLWGGCFAFGSPVLLEHRGWTWGGAELT
ncbi:phosphatidylinositol transfer protein beta isoform isoform X2 [Tiliqua scincoides]